MLKSPNTTILGFLTIIGAVIAGLIPLLDGNPTTNRNWGEVGAGIMAGVGLILAKDETKSGKPVSVAPFIAKILLVACNPFEPFLGILDRSARDY